jgi:hypothetical protein
MTRSGAVVSVMDESTTKKEPGARIPVRALVLAMLGMTVVVVAFFASYSSALGQPSTHRISVAVTAPPAVLAKLDASPVLSVQRVPDLVRARALVEDRTVYGALAFPRTGTATLLVSSGGGHSVESLLTLVGRQAVSARGTPLNTVDVAPTSPHDPSGTIEFYLIVFLGIGGAVGASILSRLLGPVRRPSDLIKRVVPALLYTAFLTAVATVFADIVYGALVGHFWFLFLILWLYSSAECLAVMGVAARAGLLASGVLIGVFIVFGNTSAGGAVPRPLLNGFYATLNPVLPQGAAMTALRGVQYFGNRGNGAALLCLAIWAVAGLALLGAAGLRAARRGASAPAVPAGGSGSAAAGRA